MAGTDFIPCLPENAPFTPEQRAYLNGFLAGLFSRRPMAEPPSPAPAEKLAPLSILFGSQTGNAENLSKRIAKEAGKRGFAPTVHDMCKYPVAQLASEEHLLMVTSTYGDGEPPDNAKAFWEFLKGPAAQPLVRARFSICALGDSNYPKFCAFGKDLDTRFESLGAQRACPRADCDVEYEEPFAKWLNAALAGLSASSSAESSTPALLEPTNSDEHAEPAAYDRSRPFPAAFAGNRELTSPGSQKETRHFEIDLNGSELAYEAGDALGVVPMNCAELVGELLRALSFSGDEAVPGRDGASVALRDALLRHYEIARISQPFLQAMAERTGDELLKKLTAPGVNGELTKFLWGRDILDLLLAHPSVIFTAVEFTGLLKRLQPRLYSISSSPKAHPRRVHLTVSVVRYQSLSRKRKGVCSTFLAERVPSGQPVPVFVHKNTNFRPPASGDIPMIMVGPGTGIAPFRAFLEERCAIAATGRNWLFFGERHAATDFLYREELETMLRQGTLHRLDTAFSRDQTAKVYVQHRLRESGKEIFEWLERGAYFYVCGDASRMAKDVDAALHEVIQSAANCTVEQATDYVTRLVAEKRYQRDIY